MILNSLETTTTTEEIVDPKQKVKVSERLVLLVTPDEMEAFSKLAATKRLPKAVMMRDAMEASYPSVFKKKKLGE
jgi:hypothetical protein